jgi:hypothetical protein
MDLQARYFGRRAASIENADLRVTVLREGGHIAEIFDKATGVNPLWTPPWPSIDPSAYGPSNASLYGSGADGPLLAGIMGHNVCLDIFGPPSEDEAKAGLTAHGEGSIAAYELAVQGTELRARAHFPIAGLDFERRIILRGRGAEIRETVQNTTDAGRAIGWTQHVTLGPPFLQRGRTQFRAAATRSMVFETTFGADDYLKPAAEFDWPMAPALDGAAADLRTFTDAEHSSAYTAHLMERASGHAYFLAFAPALQLVFGYVWRPEDFPWMGIWEENRSRTQPPWNGTTLTRGMEFGVSPFPETREQMVQRQQLFGVPTFRRIGPRQSIAVTYSVLLQSAHAVPESIAWSGDEPLAPGHRRAHNRASV